MSIQVTNCQLGTARFWIMCCKPRDLVSWCWFIVLCASGFILLSKAAAEVKTYHFLRATGLTPGLHCFVSGVNRLGQYFVRKTIRCKTIRFFAEVGRAVWRATTRFKGGSGPIRIKCMKFNNSGWDGPKRTDSVATGPNRTDLVATDWSDLFLQMPGNLTCSSYRFLELVSDMWHYMGAGGVLTLQHVTIFLLVFVWLELKNWHQSVVSLVGFFHFRNIKFFLFCVSAEIHFHRSQCFAAGSRALLSWWVCGSPFTLAE